MFQGKEGENIYSDKLPVNVHDDKINSFGEVIFEFKSHLDPHRTIKVFKTPPQFDNCPMAMAIKAHFRVKS